MDIDARIEILKRTIETMKKAAPRVAAVCQAKGIDPESQQAGEAWFLRPATTIRNIRLFIDTLEANGQPRPPKTWKRTNGQYVAKVFPSTIWDRIMFGGHEAEIWIENGKPPTQGKIYRDKTYGVAKEGAVSLVLGAGNISSIGPMDALHKLVVEDEVVLLKRIQSTPMSVHSSKRASLRSSKRAFSKSSTVAQASANISASIRTLPASTSLAPMRPTTRLSGGDEKRTDQAQEGQRSEIENPNFIRAWLCDTGDGCTWPIQ